MFVFNRSGTLYMQSVMHAWPRTARFKGIISGGSNQFKLGTLMVHVILKHVKFASVGGCCLLTDLTSLPGDGDAFIVIVNVDIHINVVTWKRTVKTRYRVGTVVLVVRTPSHVVGQNSYILHARGCGERGGEEGEERRKDRGGRKRGKERREEGEGGRGEERGEE